VEVDLAGVLPDGQKYQVVRAQDFFGRPVAAGVHGGKPVPLPMRPTTPPWPVGMTQSPAPPTAPEFEVFVLLPEK
jgi:hypothetical protein